MIGIRGIYTTKSINCITTYVIRRGCISAEVIAAQLHRDDFASLNVAFDVEGERHKSLNLNFLDRWQESKQCDQMVRTFFNIWLFTTLKLCPIA